MLLIYRLRKNHAMHVVSSKEDRVGRLGRVTRLIRLGVRASSPTRAYNHFIEQVLPCGIYYINSETH